MKKKYVIPECTAYELHMGALCEISRSEKEITVNASGSNAGLSKGFGGGLWDDSSDSYDEE